MQERTTSALDGLVQRITYHPAKRMHYFRALPLAERSVVFNKLSPGMRQKVLNKLSLDEAVDLLDHFDLRRAHYILDYMKDARRRQRIAMRLKNDLHGKIEHFLSFHPLASVGLVHLNYVLLSDSATVGETATIIEDYLGNTGKIPVVLIQKAGMLMGEVSLGVLVRESNRSFLGTYVTPIKTIVYNSNPHDILATCTSELHKKIAVLDTDGSVLGVVYSDDLLDLLGESPATALYSFAGVEESERPFDGVMSKVQHRYRWLILNLGTAFLAAGVVAYFEGTIAEIALLAMYMPVIAGMGGNAATQTLAIMVRGIAIGEITLHNSRRALVREAGAGFINGVITGSLVAFVAILLNQSPLFGLVVGISVMASLVVAAVAGTTIPLLMKYLGKDPATSATIFMTTITDVLGFIIFLGLAKLILT
ncbi:MAG: magnesium transporter [Candidatus Paceibacterota bacterium]